MQRSETHHCGFVNSNGALRFASRTLQESQIRKLAGNVSVRHAASIRAASCLHSSVIDSGFPTLPRLCVFHATDSHQHRRTAVSFPVCHDRADCGEYDLLRGHRFRIERKAAGAVAAAVWRRTESAGMDSRRVCSRWFHAPDRQYVLFVGIRTGC